MDRLVSVEGVGSWHALQLRHLFALSAVAHEGSFSRAAASLGYTQSAVSQQLAGLERIVGQRLVDRDRASRTATLTAAGQRLLDHATAIQAHLLTAEAALAALEKGKAGVVRVGVYQSVGAQLAPSLITRFREDHPEFDLQITDAPTDHELLPKLEAGELDFAFLDLPVDAGESVDVEPLFADDYVLGVEAASDLAASGTISLAALAGLRLIVFKRSGSTRQVLSYLRRRGVTPNVVLRSDDISIVLGFVAAGHGAALIPRLATAADGIVPIAVADSLPPRMVGIAWKAERAADPALCAWTELVRRTAFAYARQ